MIKYLLIALIYVPNMSGHGHELLYEEHPTYDDCVKVGNLYKEEDTRASFICIPIQGQLVSNVER